MQIAERRKNALQILSSKCIRSYRHFKIQKSTNALQAKVADETAVHDTTHQKSVPRKAGISLM